MFLYQKYQNVASCDKVQKYTKYKSIQSTKVYNMTLVWCKRFVVLVRLVTTANVPKRMETYVNDNSNKWFEQTTTVNEIHNSKFTWQYLRRYYKRSQPTECALDYKIGLSEQS